MAEVGARGAPAGRGLWAALGACGFVGVLGLGLVGWAVANEPRAEAEPKPVVTSDRPKTYATPAPEQTPLQQSPTATPSAVAAVGIATLADQGWVAELADRTGIPARALSAYAGGALRTQMDYPECDLDWATLAGIGWVETQHGQLRGGIIAADGAQSPKIFGVALDGAGVKAIRDTDGGLIDGDQQWDRAVGPMQFIPATWQQFAVDGSGDGVADPQQIDDAVLTAAQYLCAAGGDLGHSAGWMAAVGAYNDTVSYNHAVAAATDAYRQHRTP